MKQYFIYLTTNLINGKKYIGQHYGTTTDKYLGSGIQLTRAIKKYGKENFQREILEIVSENTVDEKEKYYIDLYNAVASEEYYNIAEGGNGLDVIKLNKAKEQWQKEHPAEHQNQIDAWRMAGTKANSKRVLCITTNEEFESICEAARHFNIQQGNISYCLQGKRKSAGKHPITKEKLYWRFV